MLAHDNEKSHPGTAAVLSFIFNGLGQLYNGEIIKGLVIIFFSTAGLLVFVLGACLIGGWLLGVPFFPSQAAVGIALFSVSLICICILGIYSITDAYSAAARK